ncbi:unnamed protein product [Sympodiomycopsis kandeliae]
MFNGQSFVNGFAQNPLGQPGQQGVSQGGSGNTNNHHNPAMSGNNLNTASLLASMSGQAASNPQLQALLQQQQMQQMRWQQGSYPEATGQGQNQQQQPVHQPQQQMQQPNFQPQPQQQSQSQSQPQPPSGHSQQQFFNTSAFLHQAAAGNAVMSQAGPSSGITMPDMSLPSQHTPNFNPSLMASMGSLNPQQLQALLASSQPSQDGSLNPATLMSNGNFNPASLNNPSAVTSLPSGSSDAQAMIQKMQGMGEMSGMNPSQPQPFFNNAQSGPGMQPGRNRGSDVYMPNGTVGPPFAQQRPSTAMSGTSQGDGPGTPDMKVAGRIGKGKAANRKPRSSVKPEATPTPTLSAASIPGPASSPHTIPGTDGNIRHNHRSPSVSGSREPSQPGIPLQPGPHSLQGAPHNWHPQLSVQQQQGVMSKALEYARINQVNPAEVLGKMGLMYVKGEQLPGGGNGYCMPNGAVVINFEEARLLGLPRPGHPGKPASQGQSPVAAPLPSNIQGPAAARAGSPNRPFTPQSPLGGGFPMGQPPIGPGAAGPRMRQPSLANRADPRAGFGTGAMGPPQAGPGQLMRRPSATVDLDGRPQLVDSPGAFHASVDHNAHLRDSSGATNNTSHMIAPSLGTPGIPFGHSQSQPPRPSPNLPPVHGGALPHTTKKGRPVTGMNTRLIPLPNFDRPSLTEEDLSGNSWEPMTEKHEQHLLSIMQADADYEEHVKNHTMRMHAAIRGRVDKMRPLKRRRSDGSVVPPEHLHWWERADDEDPFQIGREGQFRLIFPEQRRIELKDRRGGRSAMTGVQFERLRKNQLAIIAEQKEDLVPIRLEIDHEGWKLRDTFTWNAADDFTSYDEFSRNLCEDFGLPEFSFVPLIRESLALQIREHLQGKALMPEEETVEGSHRGNLSDQEHDWWTQWRKAVEAFEDEAWNGNETPRLPIVEEGRLSVAELQKASLKHNPATQLRIQIKLDVTVGAMNLLDQFEWDILDHKSSPEDFAKTFAADLGLAGEFKSAIAHSIREQVDVHLRSLSLVGYGFDGSYVTDEEMRGAFLPDISSFTPVARAATEVEDHTPKLVQLSEAEVDRQERERERESKRKRRQTRGRRGVNMPDRDPIKTQRTPAIFGLQATQIEAAGGVAAVAAAAGPSSAMGGDMPGVRTSTRRAAAVANASLHAQSEFDTPTPAPETRPSVGPVAAKKQRLEDYNMHFKYPGGLGRDDVGAPRFAPSASDKNGEKSKPVAIATASADASSTAQASSPNKEPRTATATSASTAKGPRPEDIANQHPNIFDGQWHCSNCGIPGWLTLGRRKGPLGEKTLCGACGKFWHRFRRMKQVEYTRDEAFHKGGAVGSGVSVGANGGLADEDSSAIQTGENTPSHDLDASPFVSNGRKGGKQEDQSSTRATTPDLPFQRVGSPSDSESDGSQSPRVTRRPSPRKTGPPTDPTTTSSRMSSQLSHKSDALPSFKRRNSVLAAQAAAANTASAASPAPPGLLDASVASTAGVAPITTSTGDNGRPAPPAWLNQSLEALRGRYAHDRLELKAKGIGEWRIKCVDCPGKLYNTGPGESLSNFEVHLKNRSHRANVASRLEKGDEAGDLRTVVTAASPV